MLSAQKELPSIPPFEKRETDMEYEKIDVPGKISFIKKIDVRYDDIDINRHANNSNYLIWALETLEDDFRLNHFVKSIDIKYRKETGLGGCVVSETEKREEAGEFVTIHLIKDSSNNEELCSLKIKWQCENTRIR
jgi:medium-chain acyl-[acyl-carrier-protein] hydrolase